MGAFDQAWDLIKMPIYHGTTTANLPSIMREGLKATSPIPDSHIQQLIEDYDYSEDDPMFEQSWLYGVEDNLTSPSRYAIISSSPPKRGPGNSHFLDFRDRDERFPREVKRGSIRSDDDFRLPVILEIPDDWQEHGWKEDPIGPQGFGSEGWVRTTQDIPPDQIKVFLQGTPGMTVGEWVDLVAEKQKEMGFYDYD